MSATPLENECLPQSSRHKPLIGLVNKTPLYKSLSVYQVNRVCDLFRLLGKDFPRFQTLYQNIKPKNKYLLLAFTIDDIFDYVDKVYNSALVLDRLEIMESQYDIKVLACGSVEKANDRALELTIENVFNN